MKPVTGHIKLMVYEWKKLIFFPALWGFFMPVPGLKHPGDL